MATRAAHKRLTREYAAPLPLPSRIHHRAPLGIQHPRMALHPHRPARHPLRKRPVLGHPRLPPRLPFRPARDPHAHPQRSLQMFRALVPEHQRFPPQELQPGVGGQHDFVGGVEFYDERGDDDGECDTGGGSTKRTLAGELGEAQAQQGASGGSGRTGFGAIKAGDGGQRFKEQWPEEDDENWKWMEKEKIDPQTGRSLVLQQQVQAQEAVAAAVRPAEETGNGRRATIDAAPQSWLSKNKWYIVAAAVFAYVLAARALGDQK
ncbi:hypothetical protein Q7P36_011063 [Cladosporium allicinum]